LIPGPGIWTREPLPGVDAIGAAGTSAKERAMTMLTMDIGGMNCGHCVGAVKNALQGVPGVEVEQVAVGSAVVAYDPASVSPDAIAQAIADEGYEVRASR
jgi:copper chaperone CopZ